MSRYCLDTSAYSWFKRGEPEIVAIVSAARWLGMPVITLGELRVGFRRGGRAERNERELAEFLRDPLVHVLDIDDEATRAYVDIALALARARRSIPSNDAWIAALALRDGATVLTFDQHFADLGLVGARVLRRPG